MISNKAFFSRNSAPMLTSFLEKKALLDIMKLLLYSMRQNPVVYRNAHFFFRQPIFRQPFLGLGSAGICFLDRTHFPVVESASNIEVHFLETTNFRQPFLVAKVQGLASAGICFWREHIFRLSKVHPIRQ